MNNNVVRPLRGLSLLYGNPKSNISACLLGPKGRERVQSPRFCGTLLGDVLRSGALGCAAGDGGATLFAMGAYSSVRRESQDAKQACAPADSLENHPSRVQFSTQVENGINRQIQIELNASYYYTALASSFGRIDVAFRGLERYFWRAARQEKNDALNLANYQNKRGGIVRFSCIDDPGPTARTTCPKGALINSLQLQRNLTQQLMNLHKVAEDCGDPVTCDFLSEKFLLKQMKRLSRNGRYITIMCRMGTDGTAIHDFDEWLYSDLPGDADAVSGVVTKPYEASSHKE